MSYVARDAKFNSHVTATVKCVLQSCAKFNSHVTAVIEQNPTHTETLLYVFCTQHGREHEVVCTQKSVLSMYPIEV